MSLPHSDPERSIALEAGPVAVAEFAPPVLLTPAQLVAAGVDITKPENLQTKQYMVTVDTQQISLCVNAANEPVACPSGATTASPVPNSGGQTGGSEGSGGTSGGAYQSGGATYYTSITPQTIQVLRVPIEGSFLKEFFNATLLVYNRSTQSGFDLTEGTATLSIPSNMTIISKIPPVSSGAPNQCAVGRNDSLAALTAGYPTRVTVNSIPASGACRLNGSCVETRRVHAC
jgi:hypothetical protein